SLLAAALSRTMLLCLAAICFLVFCFLFFFFFNDTATTEIYTLSLHDAFRSVQPNSCCGIGSVLFCTPGPPRPTGRSDRKSTRLNSSHRCISYAVFCLNKI